MTNIFGGNQLNSRKIHEFFPSGPILGKNFIHSGVFEAFLSACVLNETSGIAYGLGGHAKSAMTREYFKALGYSYGTRVAGNKEKAVFVQELSDSTDLEVVYGNINMKALYDKANPKITYNFEESMFAYPYVVLEEGLSNPRIIESLKFALSDGVLVVDQTMYEVKTKAFIILTNSDPAVLGNESPSMSAAIQRFPLQMIVDWPTYEYNDYMNMLEKIGQLHEFSDVICSMAANAFSRHMLFVSPRSVVRANSQINPNNPAFVKWLDDQECETGKRPVISTCIQRLAFSDAVKVLGNEIFTLIAEARQQRAELAAFRKKTQDIITVNIGDFEEYVLSKVAEHVDDVLKESEVILSGIEGIKKAWSEVTNKEEDKTKVIKVVKNLTIKLKEGNNMKSLLVYLDTAEAALEEAISFAMKELDAAYGEHSFNYLLTDQLKIISKETKKEIKNCGKKIRKNIVKEYRRIPTSSLISLADSLEIKEWATNYLQGVI